MPADLTNPFGPSCCAGADCNALSAQPCGCDPGIRHLCAEHKFKEVMLELIDRWREWADSEDTVGNKSHAKVIRACAAELKLEAIL